METISQCIGQGDMVLWTVSQLVQPAIERTAQHPVVLRVCVPLRVAQHSEFVTQRSELAEITNK